MLKGWNYLLTKYINIIISQWELKVVLNKNKLQHKLENYSRLKINLVFKRLWRKDY